MFLSIRPWSVFVLALLSASALADQTTRLRTTPVTDQQDTLQCWAVAATSRFDVAAAEATGRLLKLSARYTFYAKTRAEVIEKLLRKDFKLYDGSICEGCKPEPIYYEQGGIYADAVEAAKRFGVMPEAAFPGFPAKDTALFRALNHLIAHYMEDGAQPKQAEVVARVTALLDHYIGTPPKTFDDQGTTYTPREFFEYALPGWANAGAVELNYTPTSHEGRTMVEAFDGVKYAAYETANHDQLMGVLERSLRARQAVLIQYKVVDEDHTQHAGHIGFAIHGLTPPDHIDWDSPELLDHYVLAIGARFGDDGSLKALLVKNTWGTSAEENYGFHWLEADYFPLLEGVELISR